MKEQYRWNYQIRIKTKEGTYEYEDKLENLEKLVDEHRTEEDLEVSANKVKRKVKSKCSG